MQVIKKSTHIKASAHYCTRDLPRLSPSRIDRTTGSQNAKLATDPRTPGPMPSFLVRDPARQDADRNDHRSRGEYGVSRQPQVS
jgi:hypothetical protein